MATVQEKVDFYAFVVLYNSTIDESRTCEELKSITGHRIHVLILDNSTRDYGNRGISQELGWQYLSMNGNAGLSVAYNAALDFLESQSCQGIYILFDDDTNVTQEYFDELEVDVVSYPETDIFCPPIRAQDGRFYSPNSYGLIKSHQIKRADDTVSQKHFNAINSCTAIRSAVFKNYRYDERLFLDQVDHKFFEDQRSLGRKFMKMHAIIQHQFSLQEAKETVSIERRYSLLVPDFLTFSSRSGFRLAVGYIKVAGWAVREYRHTHDSSIFGWFCRTVKKWQSSGQRLNG